MKTSKKKDEQCLRESSENKLEVLSVITEKFDNNRETVGEHEEASYDKEKANHRPVTGTNILQCFIHARILCILCCACFSNALDVNSLLRKLYAYSR